MQAGEAGRHCTSLCPTFAIIGMRWNLVLYKSLSHLLQLITLASPELIDGNPNLVCSSCGNCQVRRSSIAGYGVYANKYIRAHTILFCYPGLFTRIPPSSERVRSYDVSWWDDENIPCFLRVDAPYAFAHYLNSSNNFNCALVTKFIGGKWYTVIMTVRPIRKDTELLLDYLLDLEGITCLNRMGLVLNAVYPPLLDYGEKRGNINNADAALPICTFMKNGDLRYVQCSWRTFPPIRSTIYSIHSELLITTPEYYIAKQENDFVSVFLTETSVCVPVAGKKLKPVVGNRVYLEKPLLHSMDFCKEVAVAALKLFNKTTPKVRFAIFELSR